MSLGWVGQGGAGWGRVEERKREEGRRKETTWNKEGEYLTAVPKKNKKTKDLKKVKARIGSGIWEGGERQ